MIIVGRKKEICPIITVMLMLLFSTSIATLFVDLAIADSYQFRLMDEVPPDADTEPPIIAIMYPENNTEYVSHGLVLTLNVSVKYSGRAKSLFFWKIYYESDWQKGSTVIYEFIPETGKSTISEFNGSLDLTDVPEGNHILVVYAVEGGRYEEPDLGSAGFVTLYYPFKITGSSSVTFTIDNVAPEVTVLSPENKVYDKSDVPLCFSVSELASQFSYALDGQKSVAIDGNITLSELSDGEHNVTVYAQDVAGNVGTSETIKFSVELLFPTTMVIALIASVAVISVSLLFYFKKRKH